MNPKVLIYASAISGVIAFLLLIAFWRSLSAVAPFSYAFSCISVGLLAAGVLIYRLRDLWLAVLVALSLFWPFQYVLVVVGYATLYACL